LDPEASDERKCFKKWIVIKSTNNEWENKHSNINFEIGTHDTYGGGPLIVDELLDAWQAVHLVIIVNLVDHF